MHIPRLIISSTEFSKSTGILNTTDSNKNSIDETISAELPNAEHTNAQPPNQPSFAQEFTLELNKQQSHHLTRVLRRKAGSLVELLSREDGLLYRGTISTLDSKKTVIQINKQLETIPPRPRVHILLGQPNNKALEHAIQQGCETGVSSFTIYPADHTGAKIPINLSRLNLIRDNAVEQARLTHIPKIQVLPSLTEALNQLPTLATLRILCASPNEPSPESRQATIISTLFPKLEKKPQQFNSPLEKHPECVEIYIAVGPEGGFSLSEIELHLCNGFQTTSLGPYVARVETAVAIAAGISRLAAE